MRRKMLEKNSTARKPPTDFTIDCILSKSEVEQPRSQVINPILNNNPWISRYPLALTFNPSSHRNRINLPSPTSLLRSTSPSFLDINLNPTVINFTNVVEVSQHITSIHNHFYPPFVPPGSSSDKTSNSDDSRSLPKVYDESSDGEISRATLGLNLSDKRVVKSITPPTISFKCPICSKTFETCELLDIHEKSHKKPKYECSECNKKFSQLRNFKYHLSNHRGTREFAANCPECGKTFNDKGYLSSHLKIHRNKKEYLCPHCPKAFNQRVAFNMHVRIHLGLKPHTCSECGKQFSRKMLLKQHYRTHSGEKPYKCSQPGCEKRFADRSNMILHNRLHSGVKPFACNLCPKRFSKKHHLGTHMNYHTGNKPYLCGHSGCGQRFTQSSNMRTHAKKCQYRST